MTKTLLATVLAVTLTAFGAFRAFPWVRAHSRAQCVAAAAKWESEHPGWRGTVICMPRRFRF